MSGKGGVKPPGPKPIPKPGIDRVRVAAKGKQPPVPVPGTTANAASTSGKYKCDIANAYDPSFMYLTHQTSMEGFEHILDSGYLLPPRYYLTADELEAEGAMEESEDPLEKKGLEGIFMTMVREQDTIEGRTIPWFRQDHVILVFSLVLMERDDYYFSLRDQFGEMTQHTYSRKTLLTTPYKRMPNLTKSKPGRAGRTSPKFAPKPGRTDRTGRTGTGGRIRKRIIQPKRPIAGHNVPLVKANPEHTGGHAGFNEVMFFGKVPFKLSFEIWYNPKMLLVSQNKIHSLLEKHHIRRPVTTHLHYPEISREQRTKHCDDTQLVRSFREDYKAPFCRSKRMYTGTNEAYNTENTSGIEPDEISWVELPLGSMKKIAHNCGIDQDLIDQTINPDLLTYHIHQKENEYLKFFASQKRRGVTQDKTEKEFRRKFILPDDEIVYPPFSSSRFPATLLMDEDEVHNMQSPFHGFIQLVLKYLEAEVTDALTGFPDGDKKIDESIRLYEEIQYRYGDSLDLIKFLYNSIYMESESFLEMFEVVDKLYRTKNRGILNDISSEFAYQLEMQNKMGDHDDRGEETKKFLVQVSRWLKELK